MADIISELASKSGVSSDLAKKGVGALLSFIQEKLPADSFSKVLSAIPGGDNMMAAVGETGPEPSAGVLNTISGLAGKLFGGAGGATALVSKLTQLGFSADQLQKFLPTAIEFLKSKLPPDILNKLTSLIPIAAK
jgi:hypothetical protein